MQEKIDVKKYHDWSGLNSLQIGRYAEYYATMEFTKAGFDVYRTEVDDKGIDFVVRKNMRGKLSYFDIQVKSKRERGYVFSKKSKFMPRKNLLMAVVIFKNNADPCLLLIPSKEWLKKPLLNGLKDRKKYEPPEWGLDVTNSNFPKLKAKYADIPRVMDKI